MTAQLLDHPLRLISTQDLHTGAVIRDMTQLVITSGSMVVHGPPSSGTVTHAITAMFMTAGTYGMVLLDPLGDEVGPAKQFVVSCA